MGAEPTDLQWNDAVALLDANFHFKYDTATNGVRSISVGNVGSGDAIPPLGAVAGKQQAAGQARQMADDVAKPGNSAPQKRIKRTRPDTRFSAGWH